MGVVLDKKKRTAWVTLEWPPLNALNLGVVRELDQVLGDCGADTRIDIVVLQGAGNRAFSAGVDIQDHTRETVRGMLDTVHGLMRKLFALPQGTIAVVRGVCLGGGCESATSYDLLVVSEDSSFARPDIHVDYYRPVALARLASLFDYHRVAKMTLTGRRFSAQEAFDTGLVNRFCSKDRV